MKGKACPTLQWFVCMLQQARSRREAFSMTHFGVLLCPWAIHAALHILLYALITQGQDQKARMYRPA